MSDHRRAAGFALAALLFGAPLFAAGPPAAEPAATVNDEITVTATRSPRAVKDTPGEVSVISDQEIDRQLMTNAADLVKFEPGVYVDDDLTRLGLGGFTIRGIGGNRVLTRVDGIPAGERFDFGPLSVPQYTLDLDALKSVEIVRSAGSALYGSDALGGVVSLITKDPSDYLTGGVPSRLEAKGGYASRNRDRFEDAAVAAGRERWQGSLFVARSDAHELDNQGSVHAQNSSRTAPNPQDTDSTNALGKLVFVPTETTSLKLTGEVYRANLGTQVYTSQGVTVSPRSLVNESNFDADDDKRRDRASLEQFVQGSGPLYDSLQWRLYVQRNDSEQHTVEAIATTSAATGATTRIDRRGLLTFEQKGVGGELQLQKAAHLGGDHLFTYGLSYSQDRFDQLRDRRDRNTDTGQDNVYPGPLVYPTKYFPQSDVGELGGYVQDELSLAGGRVKLVPGLRYDRYTLDPDKHDPIYLSGNAGIAPPAGLDDSTVSPRLGVVVQGTEWLTAVGQYARGFRAPAFSEVNNGFTNFASGYTTLPNPDLKPETSDNLELGLRGSWRRGSLSLAAFRNRYQDFIETVVAGISPDGLLEFQPQNVDRATISGFELRGDARLGEAWTVRGSAARIRGTNDAQKQPLNSIAPASAVLGLGYSRPRWGGELVATFAEGKGKNDVDRTTVDQFTPPGYKVIDLTAFWDVRDHVSLRFGLFNLLNETYWLWPDVNGLAGTSTVLDRYTRPGRSFAASLRIRG